MNKIKHNKFKNVGLIFELLVRQITSDTLLGNESQAVGILKKYFSKTEIAKEHKIYQILINSSSISERKANILIDTTLEMSRKLNRSTLRSEKYNLIKDIRENYNIEDFFKAKINNYKQFAATYTLIEANVSSEMSDPKQIMENKFTLLEHLSDKNSKENVKDVFLEEFNNMDKGMRIIVYKKLLEKFNDKYSVLSDGQKLILKEYINNISDTIKLREYINETFDNIKKELNSLNKNITDKTTQIKINEVINLIKPIERGYNIKDEDLISLLQYTQLVEELRNNE